MAELPRITRTAAAVAPSQEQFNAALPEPQDNPLVSAAKTVGSGALTGLGMLGNLLDLPGSMVRDALVWDNPLDQLLDPLSHSHTGRSVGGREMLSRNFLTSAVFTPNKETGISGWASDPMEGVQDVAGFAAELALDPLAWLTGGVAKAPGLLGDVANAAKTTSRAGVLGKIDKGLSVMNELDPGTHVGRALGIPQALAKRGAAAQLAGKVAKGIATAADAINPTPTTVADKAFEALDGYATIFQEKAKATASSAYNAAPQPVKSTADFIRTEGGQKVDALTRWVMSAFDHTVDNRMTETGQPTARVMTATEDKLSREFSEPVIQTLSDIAHYGPEGTADIKATLGAGQTIEDWHSEFSESLMHAIETGDTEPLNRLLPGDPLNATEGPFVESYHRFNSRGENLLQLQKDAGVNVGDLADVIDHTFRQMNPRLSEWNKARELMPNSGLGTGATTREDLFRGFYNGSGGKISSGVNRITSDPDVLSGVRRAVSGKNIGPEAAGKAVAKVIEQKYAGDVDPRMPSITSSGDFQFRNPALATPGVPATATTPAIPAKDAPLHSISKNDLSSYYRPVPATAEREFSTAAGDAFDLPLGEQFDLQQPLHRAEVFRKKTPLKYEKTAGDPADPRWQDLPDIIHQEFDDRWEHIGRYLWGSGDATRVQNMVDHVNAIEANGGVFGRHILINQQQHNQMAAKRIATARHFTDVFEVGLKNGQIRNPDALTPQAITQTVGRRIERSAGVLLGEVFDALPTFDRDRIYQNSYDRLTKADPTTFGDFMKEVELPEGMAEVYGRLDAPVPKKLDIDALRAHMDKLVVDKDLAQEMKGLHHASESPAVSSQKLKEISSTLTAQWKAGVLSFPATQARNYMSGAIANMYSGIWSGLSHKTGEDVLFNRASDLLSEIPEIVAYAEKRKLDMTDPLSLTRAAREMYAIEKGNLASMSRDFIGQPNSMDDMTDLNQMLGLLPGHTNIRSRKELATEYLATLAGKREASWKKPFEISGTTRFLGPAKGTVRRESQFAPVSAINIWGKASDDANRLTGWIEGMRQGKKSREAYARANAVQLDYDPSKFTNFERKLKLIFPFYSFFSRQTAYFTKELMTNPAGKLGKLIRLMNQSQSKDDFMPDHIRETMAIPLGTGEDGTQNFITGFGLMFEDVPEILAPKSSQDFTRSLMSRSNPLLKGVGEWALGRSSFQGGPMGGRDLADMDPAAGRILTQLGIQDARPGGQASPAFGSPGLEFLLSNSPVSRILSTTKTLMDGRKNVLERAANVLSGLRITSVSPEQKQRGIRELTNSIAKDLGSRPFTTYHISQELLDDAKAADPEKYQKLLAIKEMRKHWDKQQRIKRKQKAAEAESIPAE